MIGLCRGHVKRGEALKLFNRGGSDAVVGRLSLLL